MTPTRRSQLVAVVLTDFYHWQSSLENPNLTSSLLSVRSG
jgi:hypothetical protein